LKMGNDKLSSGESALNFFKGMHFIDYTKSETKEFLEKKDYVFYEGIETNKLLRKSARQQDFSVFNNKMLDFTKIWCDLMLKEDSKMKGGTVPNKKTKNFISIVGDKILGELNVYKFKDKMVQLLIEKSKSDFTHKALPEDNMWLDVFLEFDGYTINGMFLAMVYVKKDGNFALKSDVAYQPKDSEEAILVFFTGWSDSHIHYYLRLLLDKEQFKKLQSSYYTSLHTGMHTCPFCGTVMSEGVGEAVPKGAFFCSHTECIKEFQKDGVLYYDKKKKSVRELLSQHKMGHLGNMETFARDFVNSYLDFTMLKEVKINDAVTKEFARAKNPMRKKRGKKPYYPVKLITVSGYLQKKIFEIKSAFGSYETARKETFVIGHYMRFWNKRKWKRLYQWIENCKTDSEVELRLSKLKRCDEDGDTLPDSLQYVWDKKHEVIMVYKENHIRNKGSEKDKRNTVRVIEQ